MPHVIVKLWPGKSEQKKKQLSDAIAQQVMEVLHYEAESVSVGIQEVPAEQWKDKVYKPDIQDRSSTLYKKSAYTM